MKKRSTNINQHYVPQFYLRNFTNSRGKLCVYDIFRNNHYLKSPAGECNEKYFYDLDTEYFELFSGLDNNYEELVDDKIRILNEEVSAILINFLNTIKDIKDKLQFKSKDQNELYNFIILQLIRTPFYRARLRYLNTAFCIKAGLSGELGHEKTQDLIHNLLILGVISHLYNQDFKLNKLYFSIFEHLIDELFNIKKQIENAGKLFLINKSQREFICSSTPINFWWKPNPFASVKGLVTTFDDKKLFDIGENIEFLTIHLPISSDVSIFFFDINHNSELTSMNNGIGIIKDWNSDIILNFNLSTYLKSKDKIFSANGNYEEIFEMKKNRINPTYNLRFNGID